MPDRSRISTKPDKFSGYMRRTNLLQLSAGIAPANYKWENWSWRPEESQQWSIFAQQSEKLFAQYSNPDLTGTAVIKKMHTLIKEVRAYDNDKVNGHHLLSKVAFNGTLSDCLTFNVKLGTPLAADAHHLGDDIRIPGIILSLRNVTPGLHTLGVRCADTPKSRSLPKGMRIAKVFRFIGTEPPRSLKQFTYIGPAQRGLFYSKIEEVPDSKVVTYAWYYAYYERTSGAHGVPSAIVNAQVIF
jgi:hypothetical protein